MDPLDGDNGNLGGVFDTITGTVRSVQGFGQAVGEATTFDMSTAMIWAIILFMFFTLFIRLAGPWNNAAAERWRNTGRVVQANAAPFRASTKDRITDLENQLAAALAQIAALTAASTADDRETGP